MNRFSQRASLATLLIAAVSMATCSIEHPLDKPDNISGGTKVELHVRTSERGVTPAGTRASEIANLYVMTFEAAPPHYMTDPPQLCTIADADTPLERYYLSTLKSSSSPRLVLIAANAAASLTTYPCEPLNSAGSNTATATTLAQVEANLKTPNLNTINVGTTYITQQPELAPMTGSITMTHIQNGMVITHWESDGITPKPILLSRATAKFTVETSTAISLSHFEIIGASLGNAPRSGFIFPQSTVPTAPSGTLHLYAHPSTTSTNFVPLVAAASGGRESEPLYSYEDHSNNALFLILKAKYRGVTGYYRINIVDGTLNDLESNRHPLDIVRNTWYQIVIHKAGNFGYTTHHEAINNRASNIEYTVTAHVPTTDIHEDAHDIISNGDYFLGVSNSTFVAYSNQSGASGNMTATTVTHSAGAGVTTATITVPSGVGLSLVASTGVNVVNATSAIFSPNSSTKKFDIVIAMSSQYTYTRRDSITVTLGNLIKKIAVERRPSIPFVAGVVTHFATGDFVTGMVAPFGGTVPEWLKLSASPDGAHGKDEVIHPAGNIYIVHDHNITMSSGSARSGVVYLTPKDNRGRVKVYFTQPLFDANTITDNPATDVGHYVGAFWKAHQTGERLIRLTRPASGNALDGQWTAVVLKGDDWIKLDKHPSLDNNVWSSGGPAVSGNDPGFDAQYQVLGTATSVFGTVSAVAPDNVLYFRIGLKSTYQPTPLAPVRYGVVLVAFQEGNYYQRIWIRQGEDCDYLMRPDDAINVTGLTTGSINNPGGLGSNARPAAVRWSPYNVTWSTLATANPPAAGTAPPVNGGIATDYPTKAGAVFQWAHTANVRTAWSPLTPQATIGTTNHALGVWIDAANPSASLSLIHEVCPPGYRRPTDGPTDGTATTANATTQAFIEKSEMRQSLYAHPVAGTASIPVGNFNFSGGYYADGYFDRRQINTTPITGVPVHTAVSWSSASDIAFRGLVFFNPNNQASLFFPAVGIAFGQGNSGVYSSASSTGDGIGVTSLWGMYINIQPSLSALQSNSSVSRSHGLPIRCVMNAASHSISVSPTAVSLPHSAQNPFNVPLTVTSTWTSATNPWTLSVPAGAQTWLRLSLSSTADWSNAQSQVSGIGNRQVWLVATANGTTERSTQIQLNGTNAVTVSQAPDPGTTPGTPANVFNTYVGAFWKATERGERIIRIPVSGAGSAGMPWSAEVTWMDARWSAGDIVLDATPFIASDLTVRGINFGGSGIGENPVSAENFLMDHIHTTFVNGTVPQGSGFIFFRIGLKKTFNAPAFQPLSPDYATSFPARYAVVTLTYGVPAKTQRIFLRQGEGDDFVMRTHDIIPDGVHAGQTRPAAVKWSPYNLTASNIGTGGTNVTNHTQLAYRSGHFVAYPSQGGAHFQWSVDAANQATYARRAYHPANPTGNLTNWNRNVVPVNDFWVGTGNHVLVSETCPVGYRRPTDGAVNAIVPWYATNAAGSEMRQSLFVSPVVGVNVFAHLQNSFFGYYADGWFDRRALSGGNNPPASVSATTAETAHRGVLFYNPVTNASLFLPAAGQRISTSSSGIGSNGNLANQGDYGCYWSSSRGDNPNFYNAPWYFELRETQAIMNANIYSSTGMSIRCVRAAEPSVAPSVNISVPYPPSGYASMNTVYYTASGGPNLMVYGSLNETDPVKFELLTGSSVFYSGLTAGTQVFSIFAETEGGVRSSVVQRSWRVYPPDVVWSAALPANLTPNTTATFTFGPANGVDVPVTFKCKLNSGAWEACTSPKTYTNLPVGINMFEVQATSSVGTGEIAGHMWSVLPMPPNPASATISSGATHNFNMSAVLDLDGLPVSSATYLWEESVNGTSWLPATGTNNNFNYITPPLLSSRYYRRIVFYSSGSYAYPSTAALVTVI